MPFDLEKCAYLVECRVDASWVEEELAEMIDLLEGVGVDIHVGDGVEHGHIAEKREHFADDVPHLHFSEAKGTRLSHLVVFESVGSRVKLAGEGRSGFDGLQIFFIVVEIEFGFIVQVIRGCAIVLGIANAEGEEHGQQDNLTK